jgi:1-acyl-sn-glycerol-3-phosphate acyltransferase
MKPMYWIGYNLCRLIAGIGFGYKVVGRENIIENGSAIMASNHASYLDPPLVGIACRTELYFLARKTLFRNPVFGRILTRVNSLPVDLAKGDLTAIRAIIKLLKEGKRTVIFPEGTRTLTGEIQAARPGIGMVIAKTLAPVVPMRIFGSYEAWPKGGKLKRAPITVVVGKPLYFSAEDFPQNDRAAYQRASERVLAAIADLRPDPSVSEAHNSN